LAATGLLFGHDDFAVGRLQQPDCREADAGAHAIDQASDEKSYAHRFSPEVLP
jgi:hypothetical protein